MVPIPGLNEFQRSGGVVIHSSERRSDQELMENNKRVLVIGNGKSAVGTATTASELALANGNSKPPIQLARRQTMYEPRYLLGTLQYK